MRQIFKLLQYWCIFSVTYLVFILASYFYSIEYLKWSFFNDLGLCITTLTAFLHEDLCSGHSSLDPEVLRETGSLTLFLLFLVFHNNISLLITSSCRFPFRIFFFFLLFYFYSTSNSFPYLSSFIPFLWHTIPFP